MLDLERLAREPGLHPSSSQQSAMSGTESLQSLASRARVSLTVVATFCWTVIE